MALRNFHMGVVMKWISFLSNKLLKELQEKLEEDLAEVLFPEN